MIIGYPLCVCVFIHTALLFVFKMSKMSDFYFGIQNRQHIFVFKNNHSDF